MSAIGTSDSEQSGRGFGNGVPEITILSMEPVDEGRERRVRAMRLLVGFALLLVSLGGVALFVSAG